MITGLDHFNLRAPAEMLETLRVFYRDVLGLEEGPRPAFGTMGHWLYAGRSAVLHLSRQREGEPLRGQVDLDAPTTFDHVAFAATDPQASAQCLRAHGVRFHESRSPVTRQHQFFFSDPAGNGVELNFPWQDDETAA